MFVVQFEPSRSADPPTMVGIWEANVSSDIPKAFLVAITSLGAKFTNSMFFSAESIANGVLVLLKSDMSSWIDSKFLCKCSLTSGGQ